MTMPTYAAVDWGTTSFRAWAISGDGTVLGETRAKDGLTTAAERGFETVLEEHLAALGLGPDAPAILCGMVGSRAGWIEAAYLDTPLELCDLGPRATKVPGIARPVYILPGLAQRATWEPDVMRGEETQLLGVVAEGYRSGLVCMPGTHSKWVSLTDGVIDAFSTFMTGELFQLLRSHSILRQAVEGEASVSASPDFLDGVRRAFETPALATNFLFSIRAGWLLHGAAPQAQAARLSGLLLGLELAGAAERHGSLKGAALLASGPIAELYAAAFETIGMGAFRRLDADACVRHGLAQVARSLFSAES